MLPVSVLEEAQRDLLVLPGVGMSMLEISHRSRYFEDLLDRAIADIRELAAIPANYKLLLLQGGASLQFSMVPMNLLRDDATADYIDTGSWSEKAAKEAQRVGKVHIVASSKADNYTRIPPPQELHFTPGAAYVHLTSNNTIEGTQWKSLPKTDSPIVSDCSSDFLTRPINIESHALIYAGAQKNLGPSGVTLVIIRDDLLARSPDTLPTMLNYRIHAKNGSLYNTPNTFGIYVLGLTMKWLRNLGGVDVIARINERKAARVYAEIDRTGFYRGTAQKDSRSLMNVTFRLNREELETKFVSEAAAAGLDGLQGHRTVGGLRASIYNAFPEEGVDALVAFMRHFEARYG